jgi:hypothetical protein
MCTCVVHGVDNTAPLPCLLNLNRACRPFHNLCQTSIFLDVVLATLVAGPLFVTAAFGRAFGGAYASWMLLVSPGCVFALACARADAGADADASVDAGGNNAAGSDPVGPAPAAGGQQVTGPNHRAKNKNE